MRARFNRHEPPRVRLDDETLRLHEDEPELLAIADAIAVTQRASNRRRGGRLPAVAIAAAVAVAAVVAATALIEESRAGVLDDARTALERGPVLHAVVSRAFPDDVVVDVARGTSRPSRAETLVWFDSTSGHIRVAGRRNGELVSIVDAPTAPAARFLRAYEAALRQGRVSDVSESKRSFAIRLGDVAGVVELGDDDLPASFTPRRGQPIRFARFSVGADVPALAAPSRSAPTEGSIVAKEPTTLAAATRRARFRPLAPARLAGLPRRQLLLERLVAAHPEGALVGHGVAAIYSDDRRFLAVRQSLAPAPAHGFAGGLTVGGNPIPVSPRVAVHLDGEAVAQFRHGRVYIAVRGSSKDDVVAAAGQLQGR